MMALQLLPILQVIIILCSPSVYSVPVYGTKRYGRSVIVPRPTWNTQPYQQLIRTQRYPVNYYDMYPYSQSYLDDYYYPKETYPIYYPARTSKYEVYQAVMPYYYNDRPLMRPNYYYGYGDGAEPMVDLEEEILQECRVYIIKIIVIGGIILVIHLLTNGLAFLSLFSFGFLQNLIMSQMYNDAMLTDKSDYNQRVNYRDRNDVYGKWEEYPSENNRDYYQEDEDVKELKDLASKSEELSVEDRRHWFDKGTHPNQAIRHHNNNWGNKRDISIGNKSLGEYKEISKKSASTTEATTRKEVRGQKEEVLLRPAIPARHGFSNQMLSMMTKNEEERKRTPSVYDTIKHMLEMEKSLENKYETVKPPMRKRIISSEDSLTQQLSVLKKAQ
ncbi:hypothetical protein Trydic_g7555 [Trypoxylus dichotomus]